MAIAEYLSGWNIAAIVCLIAGIVLVAIEMFSPGIGAPGIMGVIALITAIILRADTLTNALITLIIVLAILGVMAVVILRSLKKGRLQKSVFVLKDSINVGSTELSDADMQALVGKTGVCLNTLRPSGNAEIDGRKLDVVSSGEFIQKGAAVEVEKVEGLRILVKEVK